MSDSKAGQSSLRIGNGCLFWGNFIAKRLSDRYATARTKIVARFAAEETGANPARAYHG